MRREYSYDLSCPCFVPHTLPIDHPRRIHKVMQKAYERPDFFWADSASRRRLTSPSRSTTQKLVPQQINGWAPSNGSNGHSGWREVSKTQEMTSEGTASSVRFVLLCCLWYLSSALSSNTGKSIMLTFKYPVTLTIVQFGFISTFCLIISSPFFAVTKLRKPTAAILKSTVPMAAFQVGGHISSSMAISRIPVSTVHTIKALSPLFTVAAYALLFGVSYSATTYVSLFPLTLGVMLACTFDVSGSNYFGLLCAFASAIIFVSSNIFFKKVMPTPTHGTSATTSHRLDKINLLFYSSGLAFLMMIPIWVYSDMVPLLNRWSSGSIVATNLHVRQSSHSLSYYFIANGVVHFLQNIIAFAILATTSPVTYSIASLIKRIAVICIAIVWFSQSIHPVQGLGILMTFGGLWMYNRAKGDVARGEKIARRVEAMKEIVLPTTKEELEILRPVSISVENESYPIRHSTSSVQHHPSALAHHSPPQRNALPSRPRHQKNAPSIPAPLNTLLAASTYVPKHVPLISPPSQNPPEVMVDPYPSPPKSLDSPPPELDELVTAIGVNTKTNETIRNRRGTGTGHKDLDARQIEVVAY